MVSTKAHKSSKAAMITVRLPARLSSKVKKRAAQRKQSAETLVLQYLNSAIADDDAFIAAIKEGQAAARAGRVSDFDDVMDAMDKEIAKDMASR